MSRISEKVSSEKATADREMKINKTVTGEREREGDILDKPGWVVSRPCNIHTTIQLRPHHTKKQLSILPHTQTHEMLPIMSLT